MSKIRINELARELEVKPGRIIELLPSLGVEEKKTHSSSIDEAVAIQIRRHFGVMPEPEPAPSPAVAPEIPEITVGPAAPADVAPTPFPASVVEAPAASAAQIQELKAPARPASQPLRPPLASGRPAGLPGTVPSIPVPPLAVVPGPTIARDVGIPAKPVPPPRPGQILSGPRQPLPASLIEPARPALKPVAPLLVAPAWPAAEIPRAPAARAASPPALTTAASPAVSARAGLAGQPAPRPIVPPRPDLLAKLTGAQARTAMPGRPQPVRPGMPARTTPTPVPGQPIYRGPIRPGQSIVRGPTVGAPAGRTARLRGPHPTALPVESAAPTTEIRRPHGKPARTAAERDRDREGKLLHARRPELEEPVVVNRDITISEGITVKELSEKLGIKASLVIRKLVDRKVFATINQTLDVELARALATSFGASASELSFEEEARFELELAEEARDLVKRAPVVTVMGHVDHGKTSLLDAIRLSNVAEREAGGITQHIGAYQVEHQGRKVVFIDTPGHEAFTRMRARGAKVIDIVVLVVAADDGVMPQTLEAIDHAKAARVPIVVAINKIDRPDAQPERVKQQLSDRGLLAEDWGGETIMVPVSAKTKQNLDLLLEMILLVADMQDLKANPGRPSVCSILEAELDRGRGPVATVLVRNGVLRVGDFFICGTVFGKVRALIDDRAESVREAGPATPVQVLGLESLPEVGETLQVVTDTAKAKQIVVYRESKVREQSLAKAPRISLEKLHEQLREGEVKELNVILKADVSGSAEVLTETLQKISTDKVKIRVLHGGVGAITETDVLLASASDAVVIGFNVRPERSAVQVAEQEKVDIRLHTIIYDLTQEMKQAMAGMLEPVYKEIYRGRAAVRETFRISKVGTVAGCVVLDGVLGRGNEVRLLRDNIVVYTGKIDGLRRFKDDVSEVKSGLECGVALVNFGDIKPGDVLEAFQMERVAAEVLV